MSPRVRSILETVGAEHRVSVAQLIGPSRFRNVTTARFAAMARLRAVRTALGVPQFSLPAIGQILGDRDHTTILHGLRRAESLFGPSVPTAEVQDPEETRI